MSNEINNKREMSVSIHAESESATKMKLHSGKFEMIIDEPANMGGSDLGPSPIQVLLMSLAGCINVTGHEVAKQRGMKLNVDADFEDATPEEIDSWLKETESRCPVTDNIRESTKINVTGN